MKKLARKYRDYNWEKITQDLTGKYVHYYEEGFVNKVCKVLRAGIEPQDGYDNGFIYFILDIDGEEVRAGIIRDHIGINPKGKEITFHGSYLPEQAIYPQYWDPEWEKYELRETENEV